jgi:hypothetical protein
MHSPQLDGRNQRAVDDPCAPPAFR